MKNLKILCFITIAGSICTINASESSTDRLQSFRTMINNCDKTDFTLSKVQSHFNERDYETITVNQMLDVLYPSINDLRHKKNELPEIWCNNCQDLLDISEEFLKDIKTTRILIGGNHSIAQHNKFKTARMVTYNLVEFGVPILRKVMLSNQQKNNQEENPLLKPVTILSAALIVKRQIETEERSAKFRQRYSKKS